MRPISASESASLVPTGAEQPPAAFTNCAVSCKAPSAVSATACM